MPKQTPSTATGRHAGPGTAWKPANFANFKSDFMSGADDATLARRHGGTSDKIQKYLGACYKDGTLPKRGTFTVETPLNEKTTELGRRLLARIKAATQALSLQDAANDLDVSPKRVEEIVGQLQRDGFLVNFEFGHIKFTAPQIQTRSRRHAEYLDGTRTFKIAVATDAHLCSRYERLDHLNTFFDICQAEGVKIVLDAGNQLDGEARFNKNDIHVHGLGNQVNYWVENWPQREGMETWFICGDDHEGWYVQREGIDIGAYMENRARAAGRTDVKYLGYMEHDLVFETPEGGKTVVRVQHPGGGTAYATSYQPQKIVESLSGGEKPHVLILGHYHKSGNFFVRNVHTILGGCFCDQTPFMRKKRLAAHVGGYILEITQAPDGSVLKFTSTFVPFYAEHQEKEPWQYQMYDKE